MEPLLTVEEVAQRLHTSVRFVRRLVEEHRITYVKVGTHVRVEPAALVAYIAAHRVTPVVRIGREHSTLTLRRAA